MHGWSIDPARSEGTKVCSLYIDSFLHPPHLFLQVGVTGFCMGGALTLAAAALAPEVDAAAPFYGIPGADLADVSKIKIPIQCHFGDADDVGCHSMCVLMCCACLKCLGGNYSTDKLGDCQVRRPVMQWNPLLTPSLPCLCAHCIAWGNKMGS